jgi:hypothetical protein
MLVGGLNAARLTYIEVYDADEQVVKKESSCKDSKSIRVAAEKNRPYFVKIQGDADTTTTRYELAVRSKSAEVSK